MENKAKGLPFLALAHYVFGNNTGNTYIFILIILYIINGIAAEILNFQLELVQWVAGYIKAYYFFFIFKFSISLQGSHWNAGHGHIYISSKAKQRLLGSSFCLQITVAVFYYFFNEVGAVCIKKVLCPVNILKTVKCT
jgi:hypothetical protein